MNTKGYTLIELLAVIVVLSLASILIIGISSKSLDNNKKQNFVNNAINAVSKAKLYYNTKTYNGDENSVFTSCGTCKCITFRDLGYFNYQDPDNNYYDLDNSIVKVCLNNSDFTYYVKTISKGNKPRGIYKDNKDFVQITELSRNYVSYIN